MFICIYLVALASARPDHLPSGGYAAPAAAPKATPAVAAPALPISPPVSYTAPAAPAEFGAQPAPSSVQKLASPFASPAVFGVPSVVGAPAALGASPVPASFGAPAASTVFGAQPASASQPKHFAPALPSASSASFGAPAVAAASPAIAATSPVVAGAPKASAVLPKATPTSAIAPSLANSAPSAAAAPTQIIKVLKDERVSGEDGSYSADIETENGIVISEAGSPNPQLNGSITMQGKISFPLPDGQSYSLTYVANENGFQPQSPFLPVAPEFPHPIPQFVLDQIEKAKTEDAQGAAETPQTSSFGAKLNSPPAAASAAFPVPSAHATSPAASASAAFPVAAAPAAPKAFVASAPALAPSQSLAIQSDQY